MIKTLWDRRRKKGGSQEIDPGESKGHRKKKRRHKHAATILLGLSTILPVPGAKLIQPFSPKVKKNITAASCAKRKETGGNNLVLPGLDPHDNVELWIPPSFQSQMNESQQSDFPPLQREIVTAEDLRPEFTYSEIVYPLSVKHNVDWRLVAAVIQAESSFNPHAVSPVGACGLMQLMPETAADFGLSRKHIFDPQANIEAGVKYLKKLTFLYDGDISLIAAAYNAGQGTVAKYGGIPPFEETQNYVERVISYYNSFPG